MKRILKKVLICAVIASLCLCLSSCKFIENKRKEHAVYTDSTKSEIMLNGALYKEVEADWIMMVAPIGNSRTVYVTDKDVPVLLAEFKGSWSQAKVDDKLVFSETLDDRTGEYMDAVYCREDYIKEFNVLKDKINLDSICIETYDADYNSQMCIFSKEEVSVMEKAIKTSKVKMDVDTYYEDLLECKNVYECNSDATWGTQTYYIHKSKDNEYYIEGFDSGLFIDEEELPTDADVDLSFEAEYSDYYILHKIPSDKAHLFEKYFEDDEFNFLFGWSMLLV